MAEETIFDEKNERKRIKEEKKKLKAEQKAQKKEAKQRARELADQEADLEEGSSSIPIFLTTIGIVLIWLAILFVLIKLDIGGFGSNVLTPVLKDVPVINKILPGTPLIEREEGVSSSETKETEYGGYTNLKDAVEQIKLLELQLEQADVSETALETENARLRDEVERLSTFEASQVEFERIKTQFYEEVIYAENGPGPEEYRTYYEAMDPATAEFLYKQVVTQLQASEEIEDYAQAYAEMKPKAAAGIFEEMSNNLELAARILYQMDPEARGDILAEMDPEIAARLTKIMEPES